jgi:hypothetical protein
MISGGNIRIVTESILDYPGQMSEPTNFPDTDSPGEAAQLDSGRDLPTSDKPTGGFRKYDTPLVILAFLFGVTAALGLPILWASRAFSRPMKVVISLVVTLYTIVILYLFYLVMAWCYTRIMDSLA